MTLRALPVLLSILALTGRTLGQIGPDPHWLNPNGSQTDFTTIFNTGSTVTLSWTALNDSLSDLWLTHWDPSTFPYYAAVAKAVNISSAGTLQWTIDVPASDVALDNHYVLRFYPLGAAFGPLQFTQRDSPGFRLTNTTSSSSTAASSATVTSASSSVTSTSTSTSTTTTTSISPSGTSGSSQPSSSSSSNSSGLSVGAQVGIGVGVGIAVILLFVAGCFFGRRYGIGRTLRRPKHQVDGEGWTLPAEKGDDHTTYPNSTHLNNEGFPVSEAPSENAALISKPPYGKKGQSWDSSRPPAEAKGNSFQPVEKSGAMVRPGLHEIG